MGRGKADFSSGWQFRTAAASVSVFSCGHGEEMSLDLERLWVDVQEMMLVLDLVADGAVRRVIIRHVPVECEAVGQHAIHGSPPQCETSVTD
jgi:hypothetical protein